LREACSDWDEDNSVRLRPHGSPVWHTYLWTGTQWEDRLHSGVDAGSTAIGCGEAILFRRLGFPGAENEWSQPTWYADPPSMQTKYYDGPPE